MRKEREPSIIGPIPPEPLLRVLATLTPIDEDFEPIPELALDPVEV
jgi:hypothetical protein